MTTLETVTLVTAITGAVCGVFGAVLSIINTWSQLTRNRVRLKVIPKVAFMLSNEIAQTTDRDDDLFRKMAENRRPARICIEIVNLGCVPVTISHVGFVLNKGGTTREIVAPEVTKGMKWPTRLDPREAVTAYAAIGAEIAEVALRGFAYAKTDCGYIRYGSSAAMREYGRLQLAARAAK
jgi:hypothetical protein